MVGAWMFCYEIGDRRDNKSKEYRRSEYTDLSASHSPLCLGFIPVVPGVVQPAETAVPAHAAEQHCPLAE